MVNLVPIHPATESASVTKRHSDGMRISIANFLDPVLLGVQPPEMADLYGDAWTDWTSDELKQVSQPIDFVGINYYLRLVAADDPAGGRRRVPGPCVSRTASIRQWIGKFTRKDSRKRCGG